MWASSNCSLVRESTARAPSAIAASKPCGVSCVGEEIDSTSGPRLSETMCSTLGGLLPIVATASSTNSASLSKPRARLWRRSKPIVEQVLRSIPELPQSEPPRCPARPRSPRAASAGARAGSGRCRRRPRAARPRGRGGRRRRRRGSRRSAPPRGRRREPRRAAGRRCARGGGRACGSPRSSLPRPAPESSRRRMPRAGTRPRPARGRGSSRRWRRARRPWPETWSAWLWVSSTCSIRTPCRRARCR